MKPMYLLIAKISLLCFAYFFVTYTLTIVDTYFKHAPNTLQRVFATLGRRDILSTTLGLSTEAPPTCSSRLLEAANQKKVIRVNKDYLS